MVCSHSEVLFNNKKEWNTDRCYNKNEAKHKRPHSIWFHCNHTTGIDKSIETDHKLSVAIHWKEMEIDKNYWGFTLESWKHFRMRQEWRLYNIINTLNATELFTLWLLISCYVNFYLNKLLKRKSNTKPKLVFLFINNILKVEMQFKELEVT